MTRQVIHNFLSRTDFIAVKSQMLTDSFPWTIHNKSNPGDKICDERFNLQFVHMFYHSPTLISKYISILDPIFKKLPHQMLIKAKANITSCTDTIQLYGYHIDVNADLAKLSKTAIFYLNTTNGFTQFEDDGQQVPSIENSLVIFNSLDRHTGTSCTDHKYRAVINFNFI
jgi:hypothetical protein